MQFNDTYYYISKKYIFFFRKAGQQFANETTELIERSRSRNSRQEGMVESPTRGPPYSHMEDNSGGGPVEVYGKSLSPNRRMSVQDQDIQPSIGHYYTRSPSPKRQINYCLSLFEIIFSKKYLPLVRDIGGLNHMGWALVVLKCLNFGTFYC